MKMNEISAFRLHSVGQPPCILRVNRPVPGPGEVGVRVAACGLNFADLLVSKGKYQIKPSLPTTLGMELSGTVEAVGTGVTTYAHGQRIAAYCGFGGLAEYAAVPANRCVPIPDAMTFIEAAGFLVAYGTSHLALGHKARLTAGETLLVLGAASGVGLTAVEIGKLMGARVIACARGPEKLEAAKAAGADHLVDALSQDIKETVKALGGADVAYDPVGGKQFTDALGAMRPGGRVLAIGFASGEVPQIPANHLLVKNVDVLGFWWGGYAEFAPDVMTESLSALMRWYEAGKLRPKIAHTLPLDRAADAFDLLRSRGAPGKIVVTT